MQIKQNWSNFIHILRYFTIGSRLILLRHFTPKSADLAIPSGWLILPFLCIRLSIKVANTKLFQLSLVDMFSRVECYFPDCTPHVGRKFWHKIRCYCHHRVVGGAQGGKRKVRWIQHRRRAVAVDRSGWFTFVTADIRGTCLILSNCYCHKYCQRNAI